MSNSTSLLARVRDVLINPRNGAVGVVDDLLAVSQTLAVRLDWHIDRCRVSAPGVTDPIQVIEVPLPKSAFRAILARMAVLCNERTPNAVSPYGGEGELAVGDKSSTVLRVVFTNTPDKQRLELSKVKEAFSVPAGKRTKKARSR